MANGSRRILLADENRNFVMYVGMVLQRLGNKVIPAESGSEALKLLNMFTPDMVMLDSELISADSRPLFKHLIEEKRTSGIPVVVVADEADKREEFSNAGCSGFLRRPVKLTELHDVVESSAGNKKRKSLRAPFKEKVTLTLKGSSLQCYAEDISEGGIYIRRMAPLPEGQEVLVSIPIGEKRHIHVNGKVAYSKGLFGDEYRIPPGIAVEFGESEEEHIELLRAYTIELLARDILDEQEEQIIII